MKKVKMLVVGIFIVGVGIGLLKPNSDCEIWEKRFNNNISKVKEICNECFNENEVKAKESGKGIQINFKNGEGYYFEGIEREVFNR